MRTYSISSEIAGTVAIEAKDLIARRILIRAQPTVQFRSDLSSFFRAVVVYVIKRKEIYFRFIATGTLNGGF
jgi:hypothetical protein